MKSFFFLLLNSPVHGQNENISNEQTELGTEIIVLQQTKVCVYGSQNMRRSVSITLHPDCDSRLINALYFTNLIVYTVTDDLFLLH